MVISRLTCTHNYRVAPGKLNINRVQSANHLGNSRIVWLQVHLVCQRRVQHAKARFRNLAPFLGSAPVSDWPKEHEGGECDKKQANAASHQKEFPDAFHARPAETTRLSYSSHPKASGPPTTRVAVC